MPDPLSGQFEEIRRRVRACHLTWGLSWVLLGLLGSLAVACLGDWFFHFDDAGVRLILALAVLAIVGWIGWRNLVLPLTTRLSDLDLALHIEGRYPGFRDSLASSVQFLEGNADPRVGSPALQRAVAARAVYQLAQGSYTDLIETREVRRVTVAALVTVLAAGALALVDINSTRTALARLAWPFAALEWPRQTSLRLLDANLEPISLDPARPLRLARGETLKIYAENGAGRLPKRVMLEYRFPGAERKLQSEVMRPTTAHDAHGAVRELALGQIPLLKRDVELRAVGGDDQTMPFVLVEVIPPPLVEQLSVTVSPPEYTGRPRHALPVGVGHVEGLLGTWVEIAAVASKPLSRAMLRVKDRPAEPLAIEADERSISGRFMIKEPGTYTWWFELTDTADFTHSDPPRYDVRGVLDAEPDVSLVAPAADQTVTADAVVPVKVTAHDDLAVSGLRLRFKADWGKEGVIELAAQGADPQDVVAELNWGLKALEPVEGGRILFHAEATDGYQAAPGLSGPATHLSISNTRTLTIVSAAAKAQELAQQQSLLALELERAAKLQAQARDQLTELDLQLQSGLFRAEDVDALKRTEMAQRDITSQLTNPVVGLEQRARNLLEELQNNNLPDAAADPRLDVEGTRRRLESIADELERLGEEHLVRIEQDLTQARKALESQPGERQRHEGDPSTRERSPSRAGRNSGARDGQPKANRDLQRSQREGSKTGQDSSGSRGAQGQRGEPGDRGERGQRAEQASRGEQRTQNQQAARGPSRASNPSESTAAEQNARTGTRGQPDAGKKSAFDQPSRGRTADQPAAAQHESRVGSGRESHAERDPNDDLGSKSTPESSRERGARGAVEPREALRDAQENQEAVLESLNEMLGELGRWRNENDVAQELSELIKNQAELNEKTSELGSQTLTRPRSALSPQEQADLAKLAERQKKQAELADQMERKLREKAEAAQSAGAPPSPNLRDAQARAAQDRIPSGMREAAAQIQENRMGEAARTQNDLLEKLRELENTLHNRFESDAETLVKKLKEAEGLLEALLNRQEETLRKLEQARQIADPAQREEQLRKLEREQEQLREETARLARLLIRNDAQRPSGAARRAAARMQQAGEDLEQGEEEQAAQEMRESLDDLQQAQRELAEERKQAEERLARELLDRVANVLRDMIPRQQALLEESQRLEGLRQAAGKWSRAQLLSLKQAADAQRLLKEETDALAEKVSVAEVFSLALKGASRSMERAAGLLQERVAGEETQRAQQAARQRFIDLVESLREDDDGQSGGQNGQQGQQGGSGQGSQGGPGQDGIPALAQLKMLITLQRDLMRRLEELDRLSAGGALSEEHKRELETLAEEQGQLADLARDLSASSAGDPEEGNDGPAEPGADARDAGEPDAGEPGPRRPDAPQPLPDELPDPTE